MLRVELIYDNYCPNVKETRAQLLHAFIRLQIKEFKKNIHLASQVIAENAEHIYACTRI